ncbi:hypothetical protein [Dongia deserti]|uniref:hypothetical protein n=1 Tax=Dongia deserti TaxID=2268030 RepID=UPI000E647976|nr:hypothetical protein [Dongia deserti]
MGKFLAAQIDEWISGYEQDRLQVIEKIGRMSNVLKLMEGLNDDPYRKATLELRNRLEQDVALYDNLIGQYRRWKAES